MSPNVPVHADRWLDRARRGHGDGFDELYKWLGGAVRGFAASRGAADPEGVVNEVFLKAFRSLDTFDGDSAGFRNWIFAMTRNQLIDDHRRSTRRPVTADAEIPDQPTTGADEIALDQLGNERVARLLSTLTEAQREVVVLRIIADLSVSDVAEIVGRPPTAVKRLQARALRTLEREISAEGVSE